MHLKGDSKLKAYTLTFKPISMTANGKADFL